MVIVSKVGTAIALRRTNSNVHDLDPGVLYPTKTFDYNKYVNGEYIAGSDSHFWTVNEGDKIRKGKVQKGRLITLNLKIVNVDESNKTVSLSGELVRMSAFTKYTDKFDAEAKATSAIMKKALAKMGEIVEVQLQKIWTYDGNENILSYKVKNIK